MELRTGRHSSQDVDILGRIIVVTQLTAASYRFRGTTWQEISGTSRFRSIVALKVKCAAAQCTMSFQVACDLVKPLLKQYTFGCKGTQSDGAAASDIGMSQKRAS
jgi:hypothetical protein